MHLDLHAAAGPVLAALREQTGESSQVGVLDGFEVVYVDRLESSQTAAAVHRDRPPGAVALHQLRQGAARPPRPATELDAAVGRACRCRPLTPHTITDPQRAAHRADPRPPPRLGRGGQRARARASPRSPPDPGRRPATWSPRSRSGRPRSGSAPVGAASWQQSSSRPARRSPAGSAGRPRRPAVRAPTSDRPAAPTPDRPPDPSKEVLMALTDARRQGAPAVRGAARPPADPAVHRRGPRPGHGRRLRRPERADRAAARRRRRIVGYKVGPDVQADAEHDRRRQPGLRAGARARRSTATATPCR